MVLRAQHHRTQFALQSDSRNLAARLTTDLIAGLGHGISRGQDKPSRVESSRVRLAPELLARIRAQMLLVNGRDDKPCTFAA